MDDSARVDIVERGRDVGVPSEEQFLVDLVFGVEVGERARLAVGGEDKVHCDVGDAGRLIHSAVMDLHKIRMFKPRKHPSLGEQTAAQKLRALALRVEDFQREMNT